MQQSKCNVYDLWWGLAGKVRAHFETAAETFGRKGDGDVTLTLART